MQGHVIHPNRVGSMFLWVFIDLRRATRSSALLPECYYLQDGMFLVVEKPKAALTAGIERLTPSPCRNWNLCADSFHIHEFSKPALRSEDT